MSRHTERFEAEAGAGEQSSTPASAPVAKIVTPPEFRMALVVRGFRTRYGGVVHLAPRANSHAICGAGHVRNPAVGATETDLCPGCAALTKGDA